MRRWFVLMPVLAFVLSAWQVLGCTGTKVDLSREHYEKDTIKVGIHNGKADVNGLQQSVKVEFRNAQGEVVGEPVTIDPPGEVIKIPAGAKTAFVKFIKKDDGDRAGPPGPVFGPLDLPGHYLAWDLETLAVGSIDADSFHSAWEELQAHMNGGPSAQFARTLAFTWIAPDESVPDKWNAVIAEDREITHATIRLDGTVMATGSDFTYTWSPGQGGRAEGSFFHAHPQPGDSGTFEVTWDLADGSRNDMKLFCSIGQ